MTNLSSRIVGGGGPRILRFGLTLGALIFILVVASFVVGSCSVTVESGEVGIKSTRFGANPGVQRAELRPGWHWEGFGEKIITYPTRQRTYSYTRERNSDGVENEEIGFADQTGLPLSADVNLTFRVREDMAADLYAKWRQPFEDLLGKASGGRGSTRETTKGKANYVTLLGVAAARERLSLLAAQTKAHLDPFGERATYLRDSVDFVLDHCA